MNKGSSRPWWMALLLAVMGSALACWTLESFRVLDWGHGVARTALLALLIAAGLAVLHGAPGRAWTWTQQPRWVAGLLAIATAYLCVSTVAQGMASFQEIRRGREIGFDQGRFCYRAARMIGMGLNPYAHAVVLDTTEYPMALQALQRGPCYESGPRADLGRILAEGFGRDFNARRFDGLIPKITNRTGCATARLRVESFGLKYGPSLLAAYLPFVLVWDQAGILAANLLFLGVACLFTWRLGWRAGHRSILLALVPLIAFLLPSHLRHNTFANPATDIIPTALLVAAWALIEDDREVIGAVLLALGFAAKLAPGLFYLPLLLRCRGRAQVVFAGTLALILGPFLVWDWRGLVTNLFLFNFLRDTDSTALLHGLGWLATKVIQGLCVLVSVAALVYAHRRRYDFTGFLTFLLVVHGAAIASGKTFHNNYLIWIPHLLGLAMVVGLARDSTTSSQNQYPVHDHRSPNGLRG